ncbi:MAG: hypothetical protein VKM92_06250 [Cyanobacteriota bacterium]|nr:hypothetical protein [Cyanobacteriota bacterium]
MASIPPGSRQRCSVCNVEIQGMAGGNDLVQFSHGGPGTRSKLWARVCQFLNSDDKKRLCLNQDPNLRGTIQPGDGFDEAPLIQLPPLNPQQPPA